MEEALARIEKLEQENEQLREDAEERDAILAQSRAFITRTLEAAGFNGAAP